MARTANGSTNGSTSGGTNGRANGHAGGLGTRLVKQEKLGAKITKTTDRRAALDGADYVISMIQVGGLEMYEHDVEIPRRYGIDQTVGDTLGPGGVFRGLRTIPVLTSIAKDMEELCPRALFINYSNPMNINMWAVSRSSPGVMN